MPRTLTSSTVFSNGRRSIEGNSLMPSVKYETAKRLIDELITGGHITWTETPMPGTGNNETRLTGTLTTLLPGETTGAGPVGPAASLSPAERAHIARSGPGTFFTAPPPPPEPALSPECSRDLATMTRNKLLAEMARLAQYTPGGPLGGPMAADLYRQPPTLLGSRATPPKAPQQGASGFPGRVWFDDLPEIKPEPKEAPAKLKEARAGLASQIAQRAAQLPPPDPNVKVQKALDYVRALRHNLVDEASADLVLSAIIVKLNDLIEDIEE